MKMRPVRVFLVVSVMLAVMVSWVGYVVAEPIARARVGTAQGQSSQPENNAPYASFQKIADDSDAVSVEVPTAWSDVETGPWLYQGREVGVFVAASPALDDFYAQRKTPGVFIAASRELARSTNVAELLGLERQKLAGKCKLKERKNYTDAFYRGLSDAYVTCASGQHSMLVLAVTPPDQNILILLRINRVTDADTAAVAKIFETFHVLGIPGHDDHHDH
jgi:hypothetical protein